jgi:Zn-dependent peptidase ImmA (M78 family)
MKEGSTRQLERFAKRLLVKHGVTSPPVPLEMLAKQMGADLRVYSVNKSLRGFFASIGDGKRIVFVNAAHPKGIQRWTLACELGHMLLANPEIHVDWSQPPNRKHEYKSRESDQTEALAEQLALELLLPRRMLFADIEKPLDPHDDECLEHLASRYEVSFYALLSRLEQLQLLDPKLMVRKKIAQVRSSAESRRMTARLSGTGLVIDD